jgi:hypothetical protein
MEPIIKIYRFGMKSLARKWIAPGDIAKRDEARGGSGSGGKSYDEGQAETESRSSTYFIVGMYCRR